MKTMYNCHIHIFRDIDVPRGFLPLGLVPMSSTKVGFFVLKNTMKLIDPIFKNTSFKKYIRFAEVGKMSSQEEIFNIVQSKYPDGTVFCVLTINMERMGAGKTKRDYEEQLIEIRNLYYKYPDQIKVFLHIDPRHKGYMYWVEQDFVAGVKLYTPMGYLPDDKRLTEMYEYCDKYRLPIITHCSPDSPSHWKGRKSYIIDLLKQKNIPHKRRWSKKKLAGLLCHPQLFIPLAAKYQNINFCFAHWGGGKSWKEYLENPTNQNNWFWIIKRAMKTYSNIYTDISFTMNNTKYHNVLKVLLQDNKIRNKVLFGSDFYMLQSVARERKFSFDLRATLGEELWEKITEINPNKFLS